MSQWEDPCCQHQVAIIALYEDKVITKPENTKVEKFIDDIDILFRSCLKIFRGCSTKDTDYKRVMGKIGKKGALKIQAALDKMKVETDNAGDPHETSPLPVYIAPLGPSPSPMIPKVPKS